ncbi:bifunctional demethylmenaquinone methyltransferase/2-methoxy-6-polyprenyl-1,4-benzoquinol methylase UbiE [Rathayibacter toxicus]|uniref:Demethylmenaquinone methyltransferase n=1 Tax=Rathayibacter toxicus TaxID=145458 RepID=A0A0C5BU20_9MICO|nr:bifunctional demethylmenaquinone methyltransferase/2-methoxy-6-polyprenyl-1,4-benzoquinol methylase UbiE [Rathayibacter toxicus]AJM78157.1 ubiquinone biosynthesis methyltransferase UbiE [Rathayibacter toxicus]ALS57577.1 ubiquinone biosynthesis methyltransferase UbiE [Rathayibacter toxicus]KKM44933.1 ubiquinone biosynthesis methyltransferase UbiE [Rathayibacter toxicus]PPG20755.1 bifunctional demethylmenaquinone methyltransferase/2-methoxy-6-polyprenyl-1,4-benzoquinol methylase UbiE [Rathayib
MTVTKADLTKRPDEVAAMFTTVAPAYDLTNSVLSFGNDRLWRIATTRAVNPAPGERILDVAAGTGTSSASLARSGAQVIAADFSVGMIAVGRRRHAHNTHLEFVDANALNLPFEDNSFDAVTISFGLRNVAQPRAALAEFYRVAKPGGRIVICEFSTPPVRFFAAVYRFYLASVMPAIVRFASSNNPAYDYLGESITNWPEPRVVATWLRTAGFERVAYRRLTAGIVALHRGVKPVVTS